MEYLVEVSLKKKKVFGPQAALFIKDVSVYDSSIPNTVGVRIKYVDLDSLVERNCGIFGINPYGCGILAEFKFGKEGKNPSWHFSVNPEESEKLNIIICIQKIEGFSRVAVYELTKPELMTYFPKLQVNDGAVA